jgi:hypothetical protein
MMEKKLTNSGPFMESTGKHSIYTPTQAVKRSFEFPMLLIGLNSIDLSSTLSHQLFLLLLLPLVLCSADTSPLS